MNEHDSEYYEIGCPIEYEDDEIEELTIVTESGTRVTYSDRVAERGDVYKRLLFAERTVVGPYEVSDSSGGDSQ